MKNRKVGIFWLSAKFLYFTKKFILYDFCSLPKNCTLPKNSYFTEIFILYQKFRSLPKNSYTRWTVANFTKNSYLTKKFILYEKIRTLPKYSHLMENFEHQMYRCWLTPFIFWPLIDGWRCNQKFSVVFKL